MRIKKGQRRSEKGQDAREKARTRFSSVSKEGKEVQVLWFKAEDHIRMKLEDNSSEASSSSQDPSRTVCIYLLDRGHVGQQHMSTVKHFLKSHHHVWQHTYVRTYTSVGIRLERRSAYSDVRTYICYWKWGIQTMS